MADPVPASGDGRSGRRFSRSDLDVDVILAVKVRDSGVHWMELGEFNSRTMPGRSIPSMANGFPVVIAVDSTCGFLAHRFDF